MAIIFRQMQPAYRMALRGDSRGWAFGQVNQSSNPDTLTRPSFKDPDKTPLKAPRRYRNADIGSQILEGDFKSQGNALTARSARAGSR